MEKGLDITDISWNCSGFILAAAYGKFEPEGCFLDKSYVCAWNLSKRDFKPDTPSIKLETSVLKNNIIIFIRVV